MTSTVDANGIYFRSMDIHPQQELDVHADHDSSEDPAYWIGISGTGPDLAEFYLRLSYAEAEDVRDTLTRQLAEWPSHSQMHPEGVTP